MGSKLLSMPVCHDNAAGCDSSPYYHRDSFDDSYIIPLLLRVDHSAWEENSSEEF
jgi:hypothetical protein